MELHSILKDGKLGDFVLSRFTITDNDIVAKVRNGISNGTYMRLTHCGEVVMSDTDMEKRTNRKFIRDSNGDVLIGGLGIGMIILAIQDKPEVESITVLEKYTEVIELVGKQLPINEKVNIINADVFDWKPNKGVKYDCIYMDIWNYINYTVYKAEMLPLIRKYQNYLVPKSKNPNRFIDCWAKKEAKTNSRL